MVTKGFWEGRTQEMSEPELTMDELRARGQVTEYHTEGNVVYAGMGRPCSLCKKVWLMCSHDLNNHMKICKGSSQGWNKSKFNKEDEWRPSDSDPQLKLSIQHQGPLTLGFWRYSLSQDGKYLKRRRATTE
jgi:hypothetical protein